MSLEFGSFSRSSYGRQSELTRAAWAAHTIGTPWQEFPDYSRLSPSSHWIRRALRLWQWIIAASTKWHPGQILLPIPNANERFESSWTVPFLLRKRSGLNSSGSEYSSGWQWIEGYTSWVWQLTCVSLVCCRKTTASRKGNLKCEGRSQSSEEHNKIDRAEWRKLLRSFSNVKTLRMGHISSSSHSLASMAIGLRKHRIPFDLRS